MPRCVEAGMSAMRIVVAAIVIACGSGCQWGRSRAKIPTGTYQSYSGLETITVNADTMRFVVRDDLTSTTAAFLYGEFPYSLTMNREIVLLGSSNSEVFLQVATASEWSFDGRNIRREQYRSDYYDRSRRTVSKRELVGTALYMPLSKQ